MDLAQKIFIMPLADLQILQGLLCVHAYFIVLRPFPSGREGPGIHCLRCVNYNLMNNIMLPLQHH